MIWLIWLIILYQRGDEVYSVSVWLGLYYAVLVGGITWWNAEGFVDWRQVPRTAKYEEIVVPSVDSVWMPGKKDLGHQEDLGWRWFDFHPVNWVKVISCFLFLTLRAGYRYHLSCIPFTLIS